MKSIELGGDRQARIWLQDLPNAIGAPMTTLRHTAAANARVPPTGLRRGAVEVFVPCGPRWLYGCLGGHWEPAAVSNTLTLVINVTAEDGPVFVNSLAGRLDTVRVGLPHEYVAGVREGVALASVNLGALPAGTLSMTCAAHGMVGSSHVGFKHLTAILIKLFATIGSDSDAGSLGTLFPSTFS